MKIAVLLFIPLLLISWSSAAQQYDLKEIWKVVLEKDFDIQIERNQQTIVNNQNNLGARGMLPRISMDVLPDLTVNDARQEFLSGQINEATGARNRTFHAGAQLDWVLFDGFQMFARGKRFDLMDEQAALNFQAQVEMRLYQVAIQYYTLLAFQQRQEIYEEAVKLANMRFDIVNVQYKNGAATQLDVLQAKLDIAADSSRLLQLQQQMEGVQIQLANFLQESEYASINVVGNLFDSLEQKSIDFYLSKLEEKNLDVLMAKSTLAIREQEKKEAIGAYYPQLSFFTNYNFNTAQNEVGFLLSNRVYGPSFGVTLRWNILDGLSRMQQLKNVKVEEESAKIMIDKQVNDVSTELKTAFNDYDWAFKTLQLEERNQLTHSEIVTITTQRLNLGAISPIQLREVQMNMLDAKHRIVEAQLAIAIAQLNLALFTSDFSYEMSF